MQWKFVLASSLMTSVRGQPIKTLIAAVAENDNVAVSTLLEKGANVDSRNDDGLTALMVAAQYDLRDVVATLLAHNASVDLQATGKGENSKTALIYAATVGHDEVVSALLAHNASVDIQDNDGVTPLMYAALNGKIEAINTLITHNATVNMQDNHGVTPLLTALIYPGHSKQNEAVSTLIEHNADVNIQDVYGAAALMYAASNGYFEVVNTLLANNATLDVQDTNGNTALMRAIDEKWTDFTQWVYKEKHGDTAQLWAEHNAKIVSVLLESGAAVDLENNKGETALTIAAKRGVNYFSQA